MNTVCAESQSLQMIELSEEINKKACTIDDQCLTDNNN